MCHLCVAFQRINGFEAVNVAGALCGVTKQYSRDFKYGTQYAKGRYAVCKNPVISFADIKFYFLKVQFSSRSTIIVKCSCVTFENLSLERLNMDYTFEKLKITKSKNNKTYVCKKQCMCLQKQCFFYFFIYVNGNAKKGLFLLLKGWHY